MLTETDHTYFRVAEIGRHSGVICEEHLHNWQESSPNEPTAILHSLGENSDELQPLLIYKTSHTHYKTLMTF